MIKKKSESRNAFTLIELLVVIAIIGTLTALTVGIASVAMKKSNVSNTRADLQLLADAFEEYRIQYGQYPDYDGRIDDNDFDPIMLILTNDMKNAFSELPERDRWSRGYYYSNETPYVYILYSYGASVADPDDDIDVTARNY